MANNDILQFKILTLGDTQVGKTSLILRYTENTFSESHLSTIGVDFQLKKINHKGKPIEIQVWDSAGQEKYRSISKQYYNRAHGVLLVYDVTNRNTFTAIKQWMKDIENNVQVKPIIVLVGNKSDLDAEIEQDEAKELANKFGIQFFSTSAKTGEGVEETMKYLIEKVYDNYASSKGKQLGGSKLGGQKGGNGGGNKKCC